MLRDIRELRNDPEAYAAELERRWGGLLSYRYIGRKYSSMDTGPEDNTVTLRRDMRNATGGLLVAPLSISSPEGSVGSDRETVPNPVIHSCQILDPAHDVARIEVVASESLHLGGRMGYSRSKIVDADNPDRVIALTEGQGVKIGTVPDGLEKMPPNPLEIVDSPDLPPLWQVFGAFRRDDGSTWRRPMPPSTSDRSTCCSRRPPSATPPSWWAPIGSRWWRGTSCSSPGARSARSASTVRPPAAPGARSVSGSPCRTKATRTAR